MSHPVHAFPNRPLFRSTSRFLKAPGKSFQRWFAEKGERATAFGKLPERRKTPSFSIREALKKIQTNTLVFVDLTEGLLHSGARELIARFLHEETGGRVLRVEFVGPGGDFEPGHGERKSDLGGPLNSRFPDFRSGEAKPYGLLKLNLEDNPHNLKELSFFLQRCLEGYDFVLLYFPKGTNRLFLLECAAHLEATYIFLREKSEDLYEANLLIREIRRKNSPGIHKIQPFLLLEEGRPPPNLPEISNKIGIPVKAAIRARAKDLIIPEGPHSEAERERRYLSQFRRLAREIGHCRVGLVLSPGSAKGLAHIGVIQVLEENGIEIDAVAASSMGAFVAAHWAYGYNGAQLEALAKEIEKPWGLLKLIDPVIPPRRAFFRGDKVEKRLRGALGQARFIDLSIPLRIVATKFSTMEPVVFSDGDVAAAVRASCSIPGIILPREIGGEAYVDGGVTNPLPVNVLEAMGIEKIIAVSAVFSPHRMRECSLSGQYRNGNNSRVNGFFKSLQQHFNYFALGNVMDIVMHSMEGGQIHLVERDLRRADVVLQPIACDAKWYEFNHPGKYILQGRMETEKQLPRIKALLGEKVRKDEHIDAK